MGVSLRWLLTRQDLGLRLVAGARGLDRPLVFAHSIDLPDPAPWLAGGELLLTTGMGLPAEQHDYVRRVHRAGVAALGFGVGLGYDAVPPDIVTAAEELGLPVLEVPLPTPFAAVTRAVLDRLAEQRYEAVLRVSRAQPRMTRAALRGGPAAIVRELSAATGAATLFLGAGLAVEAACARVTAGTAEAVRAVLRTEGEQAASSTVTEPGRAVTVQAVGAGGPVHGHLAVVTEQPLGHVEQVLLGHAASLLALEKEKPRRLRAERNRLGATVVGLLLHDPANERLLGPHLADLRDGVRVLVVPAAALEEVDAGLADRGLPLLARQEGDEAVVLLPGGHGREWVAELLTDPVRAGLSEPHPLAGLGTALTQARLAAAAASGLTEFAALTGAALLTAPESRTVLDSLAGGTIGKLAAHDEQLVASLRAFLEANGAWEAAAARIGVHRHTLRNRMSRVEELLGCDLGSARVRAELLLATLAWTASDTPGSR